MRFINQGKHIYERLRYGISDLEIWTLDREVVTHISTHLRHLSAAAIEHGKWEDKLLLAAKDVEQYDIAMLEGKPAPTEEEAREAQYRVERGMRWVFKNRRQLIF